LPILENSLRSIDLDDVTKTGKEDLAIFAAHFNRFRILHEEHSKHEDEIIFKTFNDFFPDHAKKYNEDHNNDHLAFAEMCTKINLVLDDMQPLDNRKHILNMLKLELPSFFDHIREHFEGEEDNLNPIGRKYIPLALAKEMSREVWKITSADRWEIIVPYIINNLPRHMQRVRYVKVLCWSMPERAQQIGAIIYRNVAAAMWERLRSELPEIIPRGAPKWTRYY
jgi:Hemerythrin HHE cation binding domain